ncbi:TATD1 [Hepatospora eriocheir]|uniref:TATD1 n=1 Tax=Hepatospora eriocheir TaxID=1081669 RepID=A0A1X0Q9Y0_9MICR|nr:TATD1 [Hepatospora eriocheir]
MSCDSDFINLLKKYKINKGVVHSFTGKLDTMFNIIQLGLYIGINGISMKLGINIVKELPLERMLIETDSPFCLIRKSWVAANYLDQVIKAKDNCPSYIYQICEVISKIKGVKYEVVRRTVYQNTKNLFKKIK